VLSPLQKKPIPIYAESIGYNHDQEKMVRTDGYPIYHWLQTLSGEGRFSFEGSTIYLNENSGILLSPHIPHSYQAQSENWQTVYLTFGGKMITDLFEYIGLKTDIIYRWESENPINHYIFELLKRLKHTEDTFGLYSSTYVYQFLLMIHSFAGIQKNPEVSEKLELLQPLIKWMDSHTSNPDIGIAEFASYLDISPRRLNTLFQETFHISPYAYFLNIRIRKAKQILFTSKQMTIKEIANQVGFRSVSHFVATFKRIVGLPPEQFRQLH
jgi:AraC-like DNA-binding protein